MDIEVVAHGQDLSSEFLDELFTSIRDRIPDGVWVPIRKDNDRVIAGLKHLIDCAMYSADFDVAINESCTHFKKIAYRSAPNVFEGKHVSKKSYSEWAKQDELMLEMQKRDYIRARNSEKLDEHRKRKRKR